MEMQSHSRKNLLSLYRCLPQPLGVSVFGPMKKKVGFFLPVPLLKAMDLISERVSGKEKWLVVSAAILMLIEAPEDVQNQMIAAVKSEDVPNGSFDELVRKAQRRSGVKYEKVVGEASPPKAPSASGPAKRERQPAK